MKSVGRKRRTSAEAERKIREWKPLKELAREVGMPLSSVRLIRGGYQFKQEAPR